MSALTIAVRSERNRSPDKPNEDVWAAHLGTDRAVLMVADGITRSRDARGAYPNPSGGLIAAQLVAQTLLDHLRRADRPLDLAGVFAAANRAVAVASRASGVWERLDYLANDLWGAVATVAVVVGGSVTWGHIGDSLLLRLPAGGGLEVCTPDQVIAASRYLASRSPEELAAAGGPERYARQQLRNHPELPHSYGALTGEPAAERYVVTGHCPLFVGDRLALLSDGFVSLQAADGDWRPLERWLRADAAEAGLAGMIAATEGADAQLGARSDDKTALLACLPE